jgi:transglutaminase-like putative cysteine protease
MPYHNPLYRVLKARPVDVLEHGGFCGNKSRLLVTLLHLRGIPARIVYLYNEAGWTRPDVGQPYVTAFVEARLDDRWVAVDPYLGILFRNGAGLPATTAELAADPDLVRALAPKWYRPEFFNYREIRGIRWGKFPMGERIRGGIARLTSPAWANGIHYPWWAQRPNLLLAGIAAAASFPALLGGVVLLRRGAPRRRRG